MLTLYFPTVLVRRWVPPAPGMSPIFTSGKPNFAARDARIMSHCRRESALEFPGSKGGGRVGVNPP